MTIEIHNLSFRYPKQPLIFEDFSWEVEKSEAWSILGPSGCGKTTLLYLLAGLFRPTGGTIVIGGDTIIRPRPQTGLVLQDHGLLPWATVEENARIGLKIRGFYGPDGRHAPVNSHIDDGMVERLVDYWLRRLGIEALKDKYPSQLSGGQRQRNAISRTLVLEPDLLLMDEPFSALDAPTREDLENLIINLNSDENLTTIIVTHSIEEAVIMGRKILVLEGETNTNPHIIENACPADDISRESRVFLEQCRELRNLLGGLV
jgi:ABC-type nitrate/sulfonate/bicarbonate transport system ATPase subunit